MVVLRQIKINNNNISCSYYPEDGVNFGQIEVSLRTEDINKFTYPEGGCAKMYIAQSRNKLVEISKLKKIPETAISIWY